MRVYELVGALADMPACAEVCASPGMGDGASMDVYLVESDGDGVVRILLEGSYEEHIESEDDPSC